MSSAVTDFLVGCLEELETRTHRKELSGGEHGACRLNMRLMYVYRWSGPMSMRAGALRLNTG